MPITNINKYITDLTTLVNDYINTNKIKTIENKPGIQRYKNIFFHIPKILNQIPKMLKIKGVQRACVFKQKIDQIIANHASILPDGLSTEEVKKMENEAQHMLEIMLMTEVLQLLRRDKKGLYTIDNTISTDLAFDVGLLTCEHLDGNYQRIYKIAVTGFMACDDGVNERNLIVAMADFISSKTSVYLPQEKDLKNDGLEMEMECKKIYPAVEVLEETLFIKRNSMN